MSRSRKRATAEPLQREAFALAASTLLIIKQNKYKNVWYVIRSIDYICCSDRLFGNIIFPAEITALCLSCRTVTSSSVGFWSSNARSYFNHTVGGRRMGGNAVVVTLPTTRVIEMRP